MADLGWFLGFHGIPLWAGSTTKKVLLIGLMKSPFQAKELRKLLLWLTLACLRNNLGQNGSIDREGKKFLSKTLENGHGFNCLVGVASNFSRALRALLEWNPPS